MRPTTKWLTLLTAVCALAACGEGTGTGPTPAPGASEASSSQALQSPSAPGPRRMLFAADQLHTSLIRAFGPVDGWLAMATPEVTYLAPNHGVVQGRRAVRGLLVELEPHAHQVTLERTLAGGDVSADGRFGFTFGWIQRTGPDAAGVVGVSYGTYLATWRKVDGCFRVEAYLSKVSANPHAAPRAGFPLLVGGPGAQGTPSPGPQSAQEASLSATDAAFAADSVRVGFSQAFVDYASAFTMDIGGRDFYYLEGTLEVADWYAGWTPAEVLDWTPLVAGASPSGDLGYTVGTYVDRYTNPDGSVTLGYGTYLTMWRREAGGSWRYIADGGNVSPAPSP